MMSVCRFVVATVAELLCSVDNLPLLSLVAQHAFPHVEMNYTVYCQGALILLASVKVTEHRSEPQTKEETSKVQWTSLIESH